MICDITSGAGQVTPLHVKNTIEFGNLHTYLYSFECDPTVLFLFYSLYILGRKILVKNNYDNLDMSLGTYHDEKNQVI